MKKFSLFFLAITLATVIHAQTNPEPNPFSPPPPPNGGDVDDVPPQTQDIPFDSGLAVLLATGVGYGLVRIRQQRK